jgi:antitoxin YefM
MKRRAPSTHSPAKRVRPRDTMQPWLTKPEFSSRDPLTNHFKYNILYLEVNAMDAVTYSDLRQNLKTYMDKVYSNHDPLIITRKNNENLILLSINEYNSLVETNYLLGNEANAEHLRKSIGQLKNGKYKNRELLENE